MRFTTSSALVAAFAGLVVASPIEERAVKKTFTINQVSNGIKAKSAPALAMLATYAKYAKAGAVAPVQVKAAAAAAQTATVVATPESYDEVRQWASSVRTN